VSVPSGASAYGVITASVADRNPGGPRPALGKPTACDAQTPLMCTRRDLRGSHPGLPDGNNRSH